MDSDANLSHMKNAGMRRHKNQEKGPGLTDENIPYLDLLQPAILGMMRTGLMP